MIIFIQYPLTDIRDFVNATTGKLSKPTWPSPTPYRHFVRSFGAVKPRGRGGVGGWVGESEICDAHHALKFERLAPLHLNDRTINLRCYARHFFYDGLAVGKYEVVFGAMQAQGDVSMGADEFAALIEHLLSLPIVVSLPAGDITSSRMRKKLMSFLYDKIGNLSRAETTTQHALRKAKRKSTLYSAGKDLAHLYLYSTTQTDYFSKVQGQNWVVPGTPLLLVELSYEETVNLGKRALSADLIEECGVTLRHYWHAKQNHHIRVLLLKRHSAEVDVSKLERKLRLYLMRIHAEAEGIKNVAAMCASGQITLQQETDTFESFQHYMNEATRKFQHYEHQIAVYASKTSIEEMAHTSLEVVRPGYQNDIYEMIQMLKAQHGRRQVVEKLENINLQGPISINIKEVDEMNVYKPQPWEKAVVYIGGFAFIALVGYLLVRDKPFSDPNLVVFIRILLSLFAGTIGGTIPGMLSVDFSAKGQRIRASGALALFIVTYLLTPTVLS